MVDLTRAEQASEVTRASTPDADLPDVDLQDGDLQDGDLQDGDLQDVGLQRADSPEEIARLAHELRIACMRVSRRVRFETTSTVAPHQLSVLARLKESSYSSGELATIERVSAPSMSRTVGALVDLGLVQRESDSSDGRVVRLSLTEEGTQTLDHNRAKRDAWMTHRLDVLTSDERALLVVASELLNRVVDQ